MPTIPEVLAAGGSRGYRLRHIGPKALIWPDAPGVVEVVSVLNQPGMVARPLPVSDVPGTPDFQLGQWAGRVNDAGDGGATFPNAMSSDGQPWHSRFHSDGHNEWIEVYNDGYLESVFCIIVPDKSIDAIAISGGDGMLMLKKAYERDWTTVMAPRDVIERATQLWISIIGDDFTADEVLTDRWIPAVVNGSVAIGPSGGLNIVLGTAAIGGTAGSMTLLQKVVETIEPTDVWRAECSVPFSFNPGSVPETQTLTPGFVDNVAQGGSAWGWDAVAVGHTLPIFSTPNVPGISDYLVATQFGFSIPPLATIQGIQVLIQREAYLEPSSLTVDWTVQLVKAGAVVGNNYQKFGVKWFPESPLAAVYGNSNDLWGVGLTPADVNASNFGVSISAADSTLAPSVRAIHMTVYYTEPGDPGFFSLDVIEDTSQHAKYSLQITPPTAATNTGSAALNVSSDAYGSSTLQPFTLPATITSVDLLLESTGRWIFAYVNGQYIGGCERLTQSTTSLQAQFEARGSLPAANPATLTLQELLLIAQQPYLMRGADGGDYALPGDASTYPSGGLHGRYFNDLDLQKDADRLIKIQHPTRRQVYSGSGVSEYANQQDPKINAQQNPLPGAATSNWSVIWFGSIWLNLADGNYGFVVDMPDVTGSAIRVWVGKTQWSDAIIDAWYFHAGSPLSGNVLAADWAGWLAYNRGRVARNGWYPIIVEFAVDGNPQTAPTLSFVPPSTYTDPGGTSLASGVKVTVPATSLSPLGCADQRYQGVSHFDLAQQTLNGSAYQASVEPKRLESGEFPGTLAPRWREGHDSNVILEPDLSPGVEPLLNYHVQEDASDFVASLQGNGAGFQSGITGQLQAVVFDHVALESSLFDVQGWQDFSDASYSSLLRALLNSQLGLRLTPWQVVTGDPKAQPRLARDLPLVTLPAGISEMRWRPGDGVKLRARDVDLDDTTPRQILTVQRNFAPMGVVSTSVGWANRPRGHLHAQRQLFYSISRLQRNYQHQETAITGTYDASAPLAVGAVSAGSILTILPSDTIVQVRLRIVKNSASQPLGVYVNGVDVSSQLNIGTGLTLVPVNLNITNVIGIAPANTIRVALHNAGSQATDVEAQVIADLLR